MTSEADTDAVIRYALHEVRSRAVAMGAVVDLLRARLMGPEPGQDRAAALRELDLLRQSTDQLERLVARVRPSLYGLAETSVTIALAAIVERAVEESALPDVGVRFAEGTQSLRVIIHQEVIVTAMREALLHLATTSDDGSALDCRVSRADHGLAIELSAGPDAAAMNDTAMRLRLVRLASQRIGLRTEVHSREGDNVITIVIPAVKVT